MKRDRSNQPLRVDQLAREIPNRAALIASGFDRPELALQLVKDLNEVLESRDYELRYRFVDAPSEPKGSETKGHPFAGRPMQSRFPSSCAVCGTRIERGEAIVYSAELRRAAHERCGEAAA